MSTTGGPNKSRVVHRAGLPQPIIFSWDAFLRTRQSFGLKCVNMTKQNVLTQNKKNYFVFRNERKCI